jgi:hypothetical protein
MKKTLVSIILIIFALLPLNVFASMTPDEGEQEVRKTIDIIQQSINNGDSQPIINLISPNAPVELKQQIQSSIDGKKIMYNQSIRSITNLSPTQVKVVCVFSASGNDGGKNWSTNGLKNYFILEMLDEKLFLLESDFQEKLNADFTYDVFGNYLKYIGPIFLLIAIFWLWMLIDCIAKPIPNKTTWVLLIIFLQIFGAILYYFIARRGYLIKINNSKIIK